MESRLTTLESGNNEENADATNEASSGTAFGGKSEAKRRKVTYKDE
jgi:hypothetical protein